MDLNQYLDRMSIKTTVIRIHDVGKAYIRLLDFTSVILMDRAPTFRPGYSWVLSYSIPIKIVARAADLARAINLDLFRAAEGSELRA